MSEEISLNEVNRIMPHIFVLIVTEVKLSFLYKSQNHYKRSTVQRTAQNQKSDILIFTNCKKTSATILCRLRPQDRVKHVIVSLPLFYKSYP